MIETEKLVQDFVQSENSKILQNALEEHAKKEESKGKSWMEDWWYRIAYHGLPFSHFHHNSSTEKY